MAKCNAQALWTEAQAAGITIEAFSTEINTTVAAADRAIEYNQISRRDEDKIRTLIYANTAAPTPAPAATETLMITDRQSAYIRKLLADRSVEGGFMTVSEGGLNALTRKQAATYIDSLTERY